MQPGVYSVLLSKFTKGAVSDLTVLFLRGEGGGSGWGLGGED